MSVREIVRVNTQVWINSNIPTHFVLGSENESARDVLLRIVKMTHYRFYWLVREQPFHEAWMINLQPLTGAIVRDSAGGFTYPWTLWPGSKPLPPKPRDAIDEDWLFVAQRFDWIEFRSLDGRPYPEEHADGDRDAKACYQGPSRDLGLDAGK